MTKIIFTNPLSKQPELKKKNMAVLFTVVLSFFISMNVNSKTYNAYPGKYTASLVDVEAANTVRLLADVWTGHQKMFRVSLPNIAVPTNYPGASACHTELVNKAFNFTKSFMSKAKQISIKDIQMENTQEENSKSHIYTDLGSLASALTSEGFARSASIKKDKPWC